MRSATKIELITERKAEMVLEMHLNLREKLMVSLQLEDSNSADNKRSLPSHRGLKGDISCQNVISYPRILGLANLSLIKSLLMSVCKSFLKPDF